MRKGISIHIQLDKPIAWHFNRPESGTPRPKALAWRDQVAMAQIRKGGVGMVAQSCDDPPRTRTWNLRLRRLTPYPLGQQATWARRRSVRSSIVDPSRHFLPAVGPSGVRGLLVEQTCDPHPEPSHHHHSALGVESAAGRPTGRGIAANGPTVTWVGGR